MPVGPARLDEAHRGAGSRVPCIPRISATYRSMAAARKLDQLQSRGIGNVPALPEIPELPGRQSSTHRPRRRLWLRIGGSLKCLSTSHFPSLASAKASQVAAAAAGQWRQAPGVVLWVRLPTAQTGEDATERRVLRIYARFCRCSLVERLTALLGLSPPVGPHRASSRCDGPRGRGLSAASLLPWCRL
jgi:hypothetical protein